MDKINQDVNFAAQERSEKHEAIIFAGIKVVYEKGYHGTSISTITKSAGIPKGSFYYYFSSKEDFLLQALDFVFEHRIRRYKEELQNNSGDDGASPLASLVSLFRSFPQNVSETDRLAFKFINKVSLELEVSHQHISEVIDNYLGRMFEAIEVCLVKAKEVGELEKDKDTQALAKFIQTAWIGTIGRVELPRDANEIETFCKVLEQDLLRIN